MPGVLRCAVACPARTVRRHRWSSQEASRRQSAGMRRGASSSRAPTLGGGAHKIQTHCRPEPCPRSGRQSHSARVSMQSAGAGAAVARRARSPYPSLTDPVGATLRGWRRKGTAHCRTAGTSCPTDEGWTGRRGRPSLQRQHRSAVRRQERDRGNIQAKKPPPRPRDCPNDRVVRSRIDGNLQCKSNDPRPVGANNRVSGNKENQCRGF